MQNQNEQILDDTLSVSDLFERWLESVGNQKKQQVLMGLMIQAQSITAVSAREYNMERPDPQLTR